MQTALYDPERGYYMSRIKTVGRDGDFATTASLSTILAKALAQAALEYFKKQNTPIQIIEFGAGSGKLASEILKSIPFWKRFKTRYFIVETSPKLRDTQKELLGKNVNWFDEPSSAIQACDGPVFCFSNELVDAFPVRIFKKESPANDWSELYLEKTEQGLVEHFAEVKNSERPDSSSFMQNCVLGQRIEVHQSYQHWLRQTLSHLKKGQWVTIDYGSSVDDLYHRRPNGSIRAYAHHLRTEGPGVYLNAGHQDITCDVNFTDIKNWGEKYGLATLRHMTQRDFLLTHQEKENLASEYLISEDGPGTAFKVLIQEK